MKYQGIGFYGFHILTVLFIALKMFDVVEWSWFWVLSPLLFGFAFIIVLLSLHSFLVRSKISRIEKL